MTLRSFAINLVSAGLIFVVGFALFNFIIMPMFVHNRNTVIVPDVTTMMEDEASKELDRIGLEMSVVHRRFHPDADAGKIIRQSLRPNDSVRSGRTVEVVVSLGTRKVEVPDLAGMSMRQARAALERVALKMGRSSKVLVDDGRERVIASSPTMGDSLFEGEAVDVVVAVAGEKAHYVMPNLDGQDLLFIREKLRAMGFRVSAVRYEPREDVFPNTIIGQVPLPGSLIRQGDSIELVAASTE